MRSLIRQRELMRALEALSFLHVCSPIQRVEPKSNQTTPFDPMRVPVVSFATTMPDQTIEYPTQITHAATTHRVPPVRPHRESPVSLRNSTSCWERRVSEFAIS